MKRTLLALAAVAIAGAACAGGDKKPAATSSPTTEPSVQATSTPATRTSIATGSPTPRRTSTASNSKKGGELVGGLFGSVLSNAFSGGNDGPAPRPSGTADDTLRQFLPADSDLPGGYTPQGRQTFRGPDGISDAGGIDVAVLTATKGDVASTSDFMNSGVLVAMVMKPDDLQGLGDALSEMKNLSKQDLEDALTQGAAGGSGLFAIKDVRTLEADGLGEGSFAFQMTIDLSGIGSIFGSPTDDSTPEADTPDLSNLVITLRMYLFSRGDYIGGLMRMGFVEPLPADVDEIALAKIIDEKLKSP